MDIWDWLTVSAMLGVPLIGAAVPIIKAFIHNEPINWVNASPPLVVFLFFASVLGLTALGYGVHIVVIAFVLLYVFLALYL